MKRGNVCLASCLLVVITPVSPAGASPPQKTTFHGRSLEEWTASLHVPDPVVRSRAATALGLGRFGKPVVPPLLSPIIPEVSVIASLPNRP